MIRTDGPYAFRGHPWTLLPLLLVASGCGGGIGSAPAESPTELPDRASLEEGWNTLRPGGETACAAGGDYRFFVRSTDSERLVLYLHGGGACWNAETCVPGDDSPYVPDMRPNQHPDRRDGIFDLEHPENPVADYSMVVVPYCTGDVHLGDRDATYMLETEDGGSRTFTVPHRGQVNAGAALDWLYANFEEPRQILVTGSSAGGVATPFYAERMARRYRDARVIGLGDAAGGYRSDSMKTVQQEHWGLPEALRGHPGWETFGASRLGIEDLYVTAAGGAPNLELYQVDQAYDAVQLEFLELAGTGGADLLELIRDNRRDIREATASFRSFTVGGYEHTVMGRAPFYFYESEGRRFRDWLAAILAGDSVPSVTCETCDRPEFLYSRADLQLMDGTLELLAREDRWDREDGGECPGSAARRSLRCALIEAAGDLGSTSPGSYPAFWDVVYMAVERLGDDGIRRPLIRLNDLESTSFEDVRQILTEVRDRVRSELEERT